MFWSPFCPVQVSLVPDLSGECGLDLHIFFQFLVYVIFVGEPCGSGGNDTVFRIWGPVPLRPTRCALGQRLKLVFERDPGRDFPFPSIFHYWPLVYFETLSPFDHLAIRSYVRPSDEIRCHFSTKLLEYPPSRNGRMLWESTILNAYKGVRWCSG